MRTVASGGAVRDDHERHGRLLMPRLHQRRNSPRAGEADVLRLEGEDLLAQAPVHVGYSIVRRDGQISGCVWRIDPSRPAGPLELPPAKDPGDDSHGCDYPAR